jgi:hypothetical protein
MTHSGQGFLLSWYSVILQLKLILSKVNAVDIIPACRQAGSIARLYSSSHGCS